MFPRNLYSKIVNLHLLRTVDNIPKTNVPSKLHACAAAKIPLRHCSNACKQCTITTKIVIQWTCLFFPTALLKIRGNIA